MRKILFYPLAVLVALVSFTAPALAAQVADIPDAAELLDLARPVYEAVIAGQYVAGAAFALVLAVGLLRRYAVPRSAFLRTLAGGTLLTYVASFGAALGTQLLAGGGVWPSAALLFASAKVGFYAVGGFVTVKQMVIPAFTWLAGKSPAWLAPVLLLLPRLFDLLTGADTVKKAEAAGAAAVAKASPGAGAGVPRDVE